MPEPLTRLTSLGPLIPAHKPPCPVVGSQGSVQPNLRHAPSQTTLSPETGPLGSRVQVLCMRGAENVNPNHKPWLLLSNGRVLSRGRGAPFS